MKNRILGPYIIGSAIIWGSTLLGVAILGREAANIVPINSVLSTAAAVHLICIWGPLAVALKKRLGNHTDEEAAREFGA